MDLQEFQQIFNVGDSFFDVFSRYGLDNCARIEGSRLSYIVFCFQYRLIVELLFVRDDPRVGRVVLPPNWPTDERIRANRLNELLDAVHLGSVLTHLEHRRVELFAGDQFEVVSAEIASFEAGLLDDSHYFIRGRVRVQFGDDGLLVEGVSSLNEALLVGIKPHGRKFWVVVDDGVWQPQFELRLSIGLSSQQFKEVTIRLKFLVVVLGVRVVHVVVGNLLKQLLELLVHPVLLLLLDHLAVHHLHDVRLHHVQFPSRKQITFLRFHPIIIIKY